MGQPAFYAIIPANVRYDKRIRPNAKLLYGEITALCNSKGYCWASNSYFSELYGVSKQSISYWVKELVDCGYISTELIYKEGTKEIASRYITISNDPIKEKFNTPSTKVDDPIKEKFNTPIKEKFKGNNTSFNTTVNNTSNKKHMTDSAESVASDFELLWKIYPKKASKKKALASYKRAVKNGVSFDRVKQGIEKYNEQIKVQGIDKQFIKQGSTWFGNECWDDEYDLTPKQSYGGNTVKKEVMPDWDDIWRKRQSDYAEDDLPF